MNYFSCNKLVVWTEYRKSNCRTIWEDLFEWNHGAFKCYDEAEEEQLDSFIYTIYYCAISDSIYLKPTIPCTEANLVDIKKGLSGHSSICLESDGLDVMDDVGGIIGFADFLQTIHESDNEDERENLREWARGLGWTGRNSKPCNRL